MKRKILIAVALISAITILGGCKSKKHEEVDLTSIHTTAATTAAPETLKPTLPETTTASTTASDKDDSASKGISASVKTYQSNQISIQYPVVSGMTDGVRQDQVNQLLKDNATALIKTGGIDENKDSLEITCKVISIDRKRITATYTGILTKAGASYPVNEFYTSTVDLDQAKNLGLNDFTDSYTMAGYVMSADCDFYKASDDLKTALLSYRTEHGSIKDYTKVFDKADFSTMGTGDAAVFPESFSYADEGTLYFSIPVPHALGDYALVKFTLGGK